VYEGLVSLFNFSTLAIVAINRIEFSAAPCCPILVREMCAEMEVGNRAHGSWLLSMQGGDEARRSHFPWLQ